MIWPPIKAWTSKSKIDGQVYFVAINYGGELMDRWVVLMSVLDSSVVVEVSWSELTESSYWESGWDEINNIESCNVLNKKGYKKTTKSSYPSIDSGLTIPIFKRTIRPWFDKVK